MSRGTITLHVPFLRGTPAIHETLSTLLDPPPAALCCLLQRADRHDRAATGIAALFGPETPTGQAALSHLSDFGTAPSGYCLRADPVHLDLGRRGLLMGSLPSRLDDAARQILERTLTPAFATAGLELKLAPTGRGYLVLENRPATRFADRLPVVGEDITSLMPSGADAARWRALLNECQTLLHHPAFAADEPRLPVNSLFFWGGGMMPEVEPNGDWRAVWSDDPVLAGAARRAGLTVSALPATAREWLEAHDDLDHVLVDLPGLEAAARTSALEDWATALAAYERDWFAPLVSALRTRRLDAITLMAGCTSWSLTRPLLRRWWRRAPFTAVMTAT